MIPFDEGIHGCKGAANPFVAGGNTVLVEDGNRPGRVLEFVGHLKADGTPRFTGDKSALIIDGENLSHAAGTVGCTVRLTGQCGWNDGKRTWLAVLPPKIAYHNDNATALAVVKDESNHLALWVYQCHDGRHSAELRGRNYDVAEPDAVVARIPMAHLGEADWARIRFSWDRAAGRVWLALDDRIESAAVKLRPDGFHALLIGTPPIINFVPPETRGIEGRIDDLVIDARPLGTSSDAALALPSERPPMARPASRRSEAVHLKGEWPGAEMEARARTHFNTVVEIQRHGGWAFTCSTPSHLYFLSNKVVMPYDDGYISLCKHANSSHIAIRLLGAYLALDEPRYLEAAERTGRALLTLQREDGSWPYDAAYDDERGRLVQLPHRVGVAGLEDDVQAHPILLLFMLSELTGNPDYAQAARRGVEFLFKAQNPNGSWSHHYDCREEAGYTRRKHKHGGEINDSATTDQMQVMLLAYRQTGDSRYLNAYLRGADWLVDAFIDKGAKGWALQYDRDNNPVEARHFEPAAVALWEGTDSVMQRLILAWRMTGNARYARPLKKWRDWMMENRVFLNDEKTKWGWHHCYDIETGRPIYMQKYQIHFVSSNATPRVVGGTIQSLLDRIETIDPEDPPSRERHAWRPLDEAAARALLVEQEGLVAAGETSERADFKSLPLNPMYPTFDWNAGSWVGTGWPSGPNISPITGKPSILCRSVYLRRQIKGQLPWNGRLAHMRGVWSWLDPFNYVMPSHILHAPLTDAEIQRARATGTLPHASSSPASRRVSGETDAPRSQ